MKVLHAASLLRPLPGIASQMTMEQLAAQASGISWQSRLVTPSGWAQETDVVKLIQINSKRADRLGKMLAWFMFNLTFMCWLKTQEKSFDVVLLRYSLHDPFQWLFILWSKKPVLLVHHTLELPELARQGSFSGKLRAMLDGIFGFLSIRASSGVVGVTKEICHYEIQRARQPAVPYYVYPNGIDFNTKYVADKRGDIPEFLFVASYFYDWHGLDILLSKLRDSDAALKLHVVGDISAEDNAVALQDSRVILHGLKTEEEIELIAASCWVGLASFALDRKKMYEACTLKVREYLKMGLPVCGGYTEVLPADFVFYKKLALEIPALLESAFLWRTASRQQVNQVSHAAIDKKILLNQLYQQLQLSFSPL